MATTLRNISGFHLQYPTDGRLQIPRITKAMMPAGSSVASSTLGDNAFEIHFNPFFNLSSPRSAFSFFLGTLATLDSRMGADMVHHIAFAFDQVRSTNWFYGLSLSIVLETVYLLEEPPRRSADFLDGHMILNEDTAAVVRDNYEELDDFLFDLMIQPFASTTGNMGMLAHEISMLKMEQLSDDDEEGECCSICLEGFMKGMVITELAPCSHRFHNACIAQWLQKKPTCPICRSTCTLSSVS